VSMTPSLFSIESLAVELGRDRRTIAKALRDVPADGESNGRPVWRITTALRAMQRRDGNDRGSDGIEQLLAEIERLASDLEAGFDQARDEPNLEKRREILREIGPCRGALDRSMEAAASGRPTPKGNCSRCTGIL
jgi:hypothetical protein